ncbi:maltose ABC transporter permease MalF [Vibrio nigripulchritudo]|uniref:maltose ABC transporter permease MalF n=1 Tax=Vibrio nigripulchritudo TaxID=28173 RepID=UPI002491A69B|nr:maltose ABC transporter permease MalF [Vibrio nigripulchritudo]BDU40581.1 maltose transport system permease protein MalF [Vibrio nigripulchritudo]BDU46318.1 maltose transport system permease protein MalF [Vibrio nigripulchritudo]
MQSVSSAGHFKEPASPSSSTKGSAVKWLTLLAVSLLNGYASVLMYAQGEFAFAILTVVLTALAIAIFGNRKAYAHRYIYPGIAGMILFIIFPLVYTVGLAFTNYSAKNQLSFERAQSVLLAQTFQSGESYPFQLHSIDSRYRIYVKQGDDWLASPAIDFTQPPAQAIQLEPTEQLRGTKEKIKTVIKYRKTLSDLTFNAPDGASLTMNGLRKMGSVAPRYSLLEDGESLHNNENQLTYKPNFDIGYYQPYENGEYVGDPVSPGFIVTIGAANFERVWKDEGIKEPFIGIFIWTIVFSVCTVVFTLMIGLVLASVVQWEALKGRAIYRVMLILPYAVPSFISILIFKGLFNQSFGEINLVLNALFGISPSWFSDPFLAKVMVLTVNTWLGFPYMMILCMGLLKAIPDDLYEASAIDGAGPIKNFVHITFPLMIRPLTPLLIATFAFNFNNFVMIMLLTEGGPNRIGTSEPAGYTDLLVSYTYRIAFEGAGGQDFGLASAIATLIFLLVGGLALLNLRFTKLSER